MLASKATPGDFFFFDRSGPCRTLVSTDMAEGDGDGFRLTAEDLFSDELSDPATPGRSDGGKTANESIRSSVDSVIDQAVASPKASSSGKRTHSEGKSYVA